MRKLIYAINITVDGCCDHTSVVPDDEVLQYHTHLLSGAGTLVFGRKTYELMVPYWPDIAKNHSGHTKADIGYAQAFEAVSRIVVVSKSLDRAAGSNTAIVRSGLAGAISQLKQEPGKNILTGGVSVPAQLIALGLVDEYLVLVQPVIAGEGRRLLQGARPPGALQLRLAETKVFASGCVALRYVNR